MPEQHSLRKTSDKQEITNSRSASPTRSLDVIRSQFERQEQQSPRGSISDSAPLTRDTENSGSLSHSENLIRSIRPNDIEEAMNGIVKYCKENGNKIPEYREDIIPEFQKDCTSIIEELKDKTPKRREEIINGYLEGDASREKLILLRAIREIRSRNQHNPQEAAPSTRTVELGGHLTKQAHQRLQEYVGYAESGKFPDDAFSMVASNNKRYWTPDIVKGLTTDWSEKRTFRELSSLFKELLQNEGEFGGKTRESFSIDRDNLLTDKEAKFLIGMSLFTIKDPAEKTKYRNNILNKSRKSYDRLHNKEQLVLSRTNAD